MDIKINDKIRITIMSEAGDRADVIGVVTRFNGDYPFARFGSDQLTEPKEVELPLDRIDLKDGGFQYRGDIGGAIMIPSFLWSK